MILVCLIKTEWSDPDSYPELWLAIIAGRTNLPVAPSSLPEVGPGMRLSCQRQDPEKRPPSVTWTACRKATDLPQTKDSSKVVTTNILNRNETKEHDLTFRSTRLQRQTPFETNRQPQLFDRVCTSHGFIQKRSSPGRAEGGSQSTAYQTWFRQKPEELLCILVGRFCKILW